MLSNCSIDHGRLVEDGTHDELINRGGRYAALYPMQAGIQEVSQGFPARISGFSAEDAPKNALECRLERAISEVANEESVRDTRPKDRFQGNRLFRYFHKRKLDRPP